METKVFNLEKIYRAYLDCRKSKRKTINALKFEWMLESNLNQLYLELKTKNYKPGRSVCFVVNDPSPREIFAASFKDRVVHHLLVNEIEEIGEKHFIADTFSCRKNKGTHAAIKKLRSFIRKSMQNYDNKGYYLQLDIAGFFMSIDHSLLYSLVRELVLRQDRSIEWKRDVLWLAKIIIFHKPTKNYLIKGNANFFKLVPTRKSLFYAKDCTGLPIGNYSSQFFANLYLNRLDQFVKRRLNCRYYVRYVDDLILISKSKEQLKQWRAKIELFLAKNLNMGINFKKQKIQPLNKGIIFLGYFIKPDYALIHKDLASRIKKKIGDLYTSKREHVELRQVLATVNSYYGHLRHASTFRFRKNLFESQLSVFLKDFFTPSKNYLFLRLKNNAKN